VLLGGLDPLLAIVAGVVELKEPLVTRSRADVLGEGGREVGTIVTVSRTTRERGLVACRAQFAEARLALEVTELLSLDPDREIAVVVRGAAAFYELPFGSTRGGDYLAVVASRPMVPSTGATISESSIRCTVVRRGAAVRLLLQAPQGLVSPSSALTKRMGRIRTYAFVP